MHKDIEQRRQYFREYKRANQYNLCFTLRKDKDADILKFMSELPNRTEYFTQLIRREIAKRSENIYGNEFR